MKISLNIKSLLFILCIATSFSCFAQQSDFIVLKKNNRTQKSIFKGSAVTFSTMRGTYSGEVESISKDTLHLLQFDVRRVPTRLGVFVLDTFGVYRQSFHYREILSFDKKKYGFNWNSAGATLLGTGSLLTVLGAGSWLVTKKDTRYYARPEFVGACAGLAALGYLLVKSNSSGYNIGKKYTIEYIPVK